MAADSAGAAAREAPGYAELLGGGRSPLPDADADRLPIVFASQGGGASGADASTGSAPAKAAAAALAAQRFGLSLDCGGLSLDVDGSAPLPLSQPLPQSPARATAAAARAPVSLPPVLEALYHPSVASQHSTYASLSSAAVVGGGRSSRHGADEGLSVSLSQQPLLQMSSQVCSRPSGVRRGDYRVHAASSGETFRVDPRAPVILSFLRAAVARAFSGAFHPAAQPRCLPCEGPRPRGRAWHRLPPLPGPAPRVASRVPGAAA